MRSSARWRSARSAPRISAATLTRPHAARRLRIWWIRALLSPPLVGEGGFDAKHRRRVRGRLRGDRPLNCAFLFVERDPSSGASRHLLPQGEKGRAACSVSLPRDLLDRRLIQPERFPSEQNIPPSGRIDRNAFSQAL